MRIDTTNVPLAPAAAAAPPPPAPAAGAQSFNSTANAAVLAIQLEEQKHGGGGGGGHGAKKTALTSIDDIAARNSLNIEERKKTMLERQREIEKLKAELSAEDQQVGEKQPGEDDERPADEQPEPKRQGGKL